jgi:hypothetical protein
LESEGSAGAGGDFADDGEGDFGCGGYIGGGVLPEATFATDVDCTDCIAVNSGLVEAR